MVIPFTDRELKNAWRNLACAATLCSVDRVANTRRLLLLYAVECGLKAVWLKRKRQDVFDEEDVGDVGHDIYKLIKDLHVKHDLKIFKTIGLKPITINSVSVSRNFGLKDLHQVWRYGGVCVSPGDSDCEQQLHDIMKWLEGELR